MPTIVEQLESSAVVEPASLAFISKADPIRVLLIDDAPIYRKALSDELSEKGFAIQSFRDVASLLGSVDEVPKDSVTPDAAHLCVAAQQAVEILDRPGKALIERDLRLPLELLAGQGDVGAALQGIIDRQRCEPRKPAPPVTKIRLLMMPSRTDL